MGTEAPSPKGAQPSPKFSAIICCDQMALWIKVPLGRKVDLDPSDNVLDGDPAPHPKETWSPIIFGPCLLCPNGWMDQDDTWYEDRRRPRPHCVTWGLSSPSQKGHSPPIFGSCLLWPNGRPSQLLLSTCSLCRPNRFIGNFSRGQRRRAH